MAFVATLLYSLLMNGLPIVEAVANGRSPGVILLLYWFETVALVATGAIRIVLHRRATEKAGHFVPSHVASNADSNVASVKAAIAGENAYLAGYLGITVIFTIAHGVFVMLLLFLFRIAGPISWSDARLALTYVIAVQALFLLWDLPRLRRWSFAELQQHVGQAPLRVLITQLGLIFGFAVAGFVKSGWGLVGTLVVLRALCDVAITGVQGLVKRRDLPPLLARLLSRTSKQSVETLEADFDRMKRDGEEVAAMLERPIGTVRVNPPG